MLEAEIIYDKRNNSFCVKFRASSVLRILFSSDLRRKGSVEKICAQKTI
jgi:hypothetical protein